MCRYQAWEDDLPRDEDSLQNTDGGLGRDAVRIIAQIAILEARIERVEASVRRLEARMLYLRKGMYALCALLLVTLVYALFK